MTYKSIGIGNIPLAYISIKFISMMKHSRKADTTGSIPVANISIKVMCFCKNFMLCDVQRQTIGESHSTNLSQICWSLHCAHHTKQNITTINIIDLQIGWHWKHPTYLYFHQKNLHNKTCNAMWCVKNQNRWVSWRKKKTNLQITSMWIF